MCGILGLVNKNSKINKIEFESMLSELNRRGPDQQGVFCNDNVALGQSRLSIIDLSKSGFQPMFNEDKSIGIVFNGEIYNYEKIKERIYKNHKWKSKSDTEVLLHGYEEYGQNICKIIEGMFAYGIYDKNRQLITLAKDIFGKKPLYYYLDENVFCFASEIKAILKNKYIKTKVVEDRASIEKFMFYGYIPSPHTIFKNIHKLEPSTTVVFDIKSWSLTNKKKYWKLENIKQENTQSIDDLITKTDMLLDESVKKRLMSDVPLGLFLSGGIDSSLIAAYLSKYSPKSNTYTVCYKDYPEADESDYAKSVAKQFKLNYHSCELGSRDVEETFLEIMDYLDEPLADPAIIPLYYVSKNAKKDFTVVLSGDGGDEIFGGYEKYKIQNLIELTKIFNKPVNIFSKYISDASNFKKFFEGYNCKFSQRQFIFGSGSFIKSEVDKLFTKNVFYDDVFVDSERHLRQYDNGDTINKSLYLDCKIQLPDWYLVKGDRATMAASVEMRNPFLDKELAEFAFSLGGNWKIRNGISKFLTKKLSEKYFSKEFIYRNKRGFGVPLDKWIKNDLKDIFHHYIFKKNELFNKQYIEDIYEKHMAGKQNNQFKLFRIFALNYWKEKYGS